MDIACILLASGYGRRYGGNKLLTLWEGVPLYRRAFSALPPALFSPAVVTSPYAEILAAAGQAGYLPLLNCRPWEGVAAGIRLGLRAALHSDGALFAVCDQPNLTTNSILKLTNSFLDCPTRIHALAWQGKKGNPVIFPRSLYPELLALQGDTGGSAVIRRHPELLTLTEADGAAELEDVDRPPEGGENDGRGRAQHDA